MANDPERDEDELDDEELEDGEDELDDEESEDSDDDGSDDDDSDDDDSDDDESSDDEDSDDEGSDDEGSDDEGSDDEGSDDEGSDDEGSDDEGSDDEDSDDEGTDDEDSDDEDSDDEDSDDDSPATRRRKVRSRRAKKGGRKTAGARLAAARAAKAARKAAKKGREKETEAIDDLKDTDLGQKATEATAWVADNRNIVYALVAALVLGLGGYIGYHYYTAGQAEASATLLAEAVEIRSATIRSEDAPEPGEDDPASYTSVRARAEASLAAFQRVIAEYPSSEAAAWAAIGVGESQTDLEAYDEARAAFASAIERGGSDPALTWRALEGRGFAYEAEENWAEARAVYDELARLDDERYEPVARYHIARMQIAAGETEEATTTLAALVTSLREAEDDEDRQSFSFVLAQAEVRLRELDPSAAPAPRPTLGAGAAPGGGPPGAGSLTPEQRQMLQELLQKQGASGGLPSAPPSAPPSGE